MTSRILVTDKIADAGLEIVRSAEDVELDLQPGLRGDALLEAVAKADALVTRSGTPVTEALLAAGKKLRVVARAGVGFDNVDVEAATRRGILVINAPTANILSATEHTMAMMLALCRNLPSADASVRRGEWKRSKFMGVELGGKTLGIIGFGRIGSRVGARAKAFNMKVLAYDPYIPASVAERAGVELVSLERLVAEADVVTVHTPLTDETRGMISAKEIEAMKDGALVVNCARGGIYVERDVADALTRGKLGGAAIDVFETEPPGADHPLLGAPNVVVTPHIGANTLEAQDRVAVQTAEMLLEALRGSIFVSAVNLPFEGAVDAVTASMIDLSEKLALFATQVLHGPAVRAGIEVWGVEERILRILSVAAMKGLLEPHLSEAVNFVNAETTLESRGIEWTTTIHPRPHDYTNLITFRAASGEDEVAVSGTLFSEKNPRIVRVRQFRVECKPEKHLIYMINRDVPGVVGKVGTILGDREINIAEYNLARDEERSLAMAIVSVDSLVDAETIAFLASLREVIEVRQVTFQRRDPL